MTTSMSLQSTYSSAPPIAYAGQLEGTGYDIITMKNADTVSMPFGSGLAFKTSSPTSDLDTILPASSGALICGILAHDHYARTWTDSNGVVHGELDGTGLVAGTILNVLRRGKIAVVCQTGCVPSDRLFVAYGTATTYTGKGQLGNITETSNAIDATKQGQWLTTATAGGFAWLDVDFTAHA